MSVMTRTVTPCLVCGGPVSKPPSARKKGKGLYCSQPCYFSRHDKPPVLNPDGLTARVPLLNRDGSIAAYTTVDAVDLEWITRWRWCLNTNGYARRRGDDGRTIMLHRELLGLPRVHDGRDGDHVDRDRLNNRQTNLRVVPHAGNQHNLPSYRGSSSQFRGVHWDSSRSRWVASVTVDRKKHQLGRFHTETEAATVAQSARAQLLQYAVD